MIRFAPALAAFGFLFLACPAWPQSPWDGWDYKFDREMSSWSEMQAQLPPYPADGTLIPLDVGAATPHRFFVDEKSLSMGNDGVVRYTLVIKTAGGATNVSFEGIRCETHEQKYYAIGRRDGTWVRARNPQWRFVRHQDANAHHTTLHGEHFCRGKLTMGSVAEIIANLRRGPPPAPRVD